MVAISLGRRGAWDSALGGDRSISEADAGTDSPLRSAPTVSPGRRLARCCCRLVAAARRRGSAWAAAKLLGRKRTSGGGMARRTSGRVRRDRGRWPRPVRTVPPRRSRPGTRAESSTGRWRFRSLLGGLERQAGQALAALEWEQAEQPPRRFPFPRADPSIALPLPSGCSPPATRPRPRGCSLGSTRTISVVLPGLR